MNLFKKFLLLLIFSGFSFFNCTKNEVSSSISPTYIQLVNTYFGKTFSLQSGGKNTIGNVPFDITSPFASGPPGFYSLNVKDSSTGNNILAGNINLQSGTRYSLFLLRDSTPNSDSVFYSLVTDNSTRPIFDSCRIRFLIFARNLPPVTFRLFYLTGKLSGDSLDFANENGRTYLDNNSQPSVSQFVTIPALPATEFSLRITYINDNLQLTNIIPDTTLPFNKNNLYTLYFEGDYNDSSTDGNRLQLKMLVQ